MMAAEVKSAGLLGSDVKKLILKLAVPTMLTMLVTTFYNMADAFFVGTINASASGAVSVIFSFMAIVQACGFFFGHGSGNYISHKLGEGDRDEAERMASAGFFSALAFGFVLMAAGLVFTGEFAVFLGSTPTIKPYAVDYLRFILVGTPYMTASLVLNNQLRYQGSAVYAMIGICTGGLLNVGLDALFILGFGMGTAGAGLATAISQFVSFIMLLIGTRVGGNLPISPRSLTFKVFYIKEIIRGGLPSLGRQSISSVAVIAINHAVALTVSSDVDEMIAALGIVARITGFFASSIVGFGQGFQPVCGFNYGAGKFDRVLKGYFFSVSVATAMALTFGLVGILFTRRILSLFTASDAVVEYAVLPYVTQCAALAGFGFITISNMLLQNIGKVVGATVLAVSRQGICFLPLLGLFAVLFGGTGICVAQAAADAATFILAFPLVLPTVFRLKKA